jgi:hypothetical protein
MTLEKTAFAIIFVIVIAFAAITWRESRNDRARLEKSIATQQQIINAAELREQTRDADLKATLSQIAATRKTVQTPQQIVNALEQFPDLPQSTTRGATLSIEQPNPEKVSLRPETAMLPDATATNCRKSLSSQSEVASPAISILKSDIADFFASKSHSPDSPAPRLNGDSTSPTDVTPNSTAIDTTPIPTADLKSLFDRIQNCRSCEAQLSVSEADLADEKIRSASLVQERNAALTTAKGGNVWHRMKQNAKWLTIGAIVSISVSRIR